MRRLAIFISLVMLCCGCASVQPQLEGGSAVEVARVPDKVFRTYLIEQGYVEPCRWPVKGIGLRMWHRDVVRRTPMGRALQLLNVHNMGIESLQGVELFDSLKVLICSENPLQRVDLSHCPRLKQFSAIETPLQELDLSHCAELKLIELSHNKLRHLDVSHNPKLEEIFCVFSPGITSLDLSANPNLRTLYLRQTSVQIVDIRHNPSFRKLYALDTPLEYIVVSPHNSLDSITVMVEDGVEVCTLPPEASLPEVHLIGQSDTIAVRTISHNAHEQKVMTHTQARAAGIDETHLREVVYKPAFTFDTLTKKYEDWGLVHSDKELAQFILTWQVFLQGMADEMAERHFDVDKPYKGHCVVFFSEDGYVDYFLYNFLGDERPSSEQQQRFEQIVRSYIANNPIGYYGSRPFSQCGGFVIQPNHSNTEGK